MDLEFWIKSEALTATEYIVGRWPWQILGAISAEAAV